MLPPGIQSKIALISDIHANLPALEAVLADIDRRGDIAATYHIGDLVGYATWPNEVVALIESRGIAGVAGNYDSTVATDYKHCGCKYEDARQEQQSHESYAWTREHVSPETKRFLGRLPFRLDIRAAGGHLAGPNIILVHGTPTLNTVYWTDDRPNSFCAQMAKIAGVGGGDVIAFGHTHKPWQRTVDSVHFVNTGSVGRPKDGDPRAGYVVVSVAGRGITMECVRVAYDVARAAAAIRASDLPNDLATFLETGGAA